MQHSGPGKDRELFPPRLEGAVGGDSVTIRGSSLIETAHPGQARSNHLHELF